MASGKTSLLSQIQSDALDEGISISTALRKCLILGGESGVVAVAGVGEA